MFLEKQTQKSLNVLHTSKSTSFLTSNDNIQYNFLWTQSMQNID